MGKRKQSGKECFNNTLQIVFDLAIEETIEGFYYKLDGLDECNWFVNRLAKLIELGTVPADLIFVVSFDGQSAIKCNHRGLEQLIERYGKFK